MKLSRKFYTGEDVVSIARDLLGKFLVTSIDGQLSSGMITETEAYAGRNDKACHANNGKRTKRTEVMFHEGGKAYVYLCYGIHHLFNVTTNKDGYADAVLIRAVEPTEGLSTMLERRGLSQPQTRLTAGPGALSMALGITIDLYGSDLTGPTVWIEDRGIRLPDHGIASGARVGVGYAGEDALKPWRFGIRDSMWISKPHIS